MRACICRGVRRRRRLDSASRGDDSDRLLTIDHYVHVKSTVPAHRRPAGAAVRARACRSPATASRGTISPDRVVLFVHGAGTPAEVAFDLPYQDYSWMAYLARAGFDVFSRGHDRLRPVHAAGADERSLQPGDGSAGEWIPTLLPAPCAPTYPHALTTIASDWDDVGAVVDHIRALRRVERVSLVAWSLGGPRAGGYAARHPDKVNAPRAAGACVQRTRAATPPAKCPPTAPPSTRSRAPIRRDWDRQIGCADAVDPAASDVVWSEMIDRIPLGATWGPGVRRAPQTTTWGWNQAVGQDADADADGGRRSRCAGGAERVSASCTPISAPRRK